MKIVRMQLVRQYDCPRSPPATSSSVSAVRLRTVSRLRDSFRLTFALGSFVFILLIFVSFLGQRALSWASIQEDRKRTEKDDSSVCGAVLDGSGGSMLAQATLGDARINGVVPPWSKGNAKD